MAAPTEGPEPTEASEPAGIVRPTLRIVHGSPSPEEVAVLTAVLAASSSDGGGPAPRVRSLWADPAHLVRRPLRTGRGAWAASGRK